MSREIHHRYADPLDTVWLATAARLGIRVVRSSDVYASWDGAGTLTLSSAEHFDADDCLAQLILHELCHALVQGPEAWTQPDWGLDNTSEADVPREQACQRLQAALADTVGLRTFFGSTTDFRAYYDALPGDPLAGPEGGSLADREGESDAATDLARAGFARSALAPFAEPLRAALAATAGIVGVTAAFAEGDSLFAADLRGAGR